MPTPDHGRYGCIYLMEAAGVLKTLRKRNKKKTRKDTTEISHYIAGFPINDIPLRILPIKTILIRGILHIF
jgi:hypothetical protein